MKTLHSFHSVPLLLLVLLMLALGLQPVAAQPPLVTAAQPALSNVERPQFVPVSVVEAERTALYFPLTDSLRRRLGPGKMVESSAILAPNGLLTTEIHIWAYNWFSGFHGCTAVLLRNQFNQPFYVAPVVYREWVNGTAWGNSNKTRFYSLNVPLDVVQQTRSIQVLIEECPNDVWVNINRTLDRSSDMAERARRILQIFSS